MRHLVHLITDLGDSALLLPASALLLAYLLYLRSTRTARIWAMTLILCAFLTILAKIAVYTCGTNFTLADLHSPSGHTSVSVTFYGCCALMVSADRTRWIRVMAILGSVALAFAIAVSRVLLQAHTVSDVIAGFVIGVVCVAWFATRYLAQPPALLPWGPAIVALGLVALTMHNHHWTVEHVIAQVAQLLHADVRFCA